jgi:two-component system CheB/CheR fusion protein
MRINNTSANKAKIKKVDEKVETNFATKSKQATISKNNTAESNIDLSKVKLPSYVVGIGSSAESLEALELLFSNMPIKTGMAFVVVQHLSPDYKSMMAELLARKTKIMIKVAEDKMVIEADTIYLLPPKKVMIAANKKLYLTETENNETINLPINRLFRSLAETYQDKSVAIVLSGTGSDGSIGVVKVHDSGGFVIIQTPESCKFDSMPKNAIKTNKIDLVYSPQSIPSALVKYSKRIAKVEQPFNLVNLNAEVSEFYEILILLNNTFDLDFSQYKPSTITRRIERRVSYQKSASLKDYINVLLFNKDELEALYSDLLIGITQFFRDIDAYNSVKRLIPELLEKFKDEPEIRIWVSACASGQEAYGMAMMFADLMSKDPNGNKPFKIFATDIHHKSIQQAAAGIYDEAAMQSLNPEYRIRFFTHLSSGNYQILPEIRKKIVFAQHNLLKDPPFTRTHLISCRNLLIYFNTAVQQRVLSLLSFSLTNQGLLLMGPSETIGSHARDFEIVDTVNRLFRKTRSTLRPDVMPLVVRSSLAPNIPSSVIAIDNVPTSTKSKKALEILLQKHVPTSVLVDEKGHILHVFGDAGKYLTFNFGAASLNITSLVGDSAKVVLTQMLHSMMKHYKPLKAKAVEGFNNCEAVDVSMTVLSESPSDLNYFIISLSESDTANTLDANESAIIDLKPQEQKTIFSKIKHKKYEEELIFVQKNLQTTIEELETSNEELLASNEELLASNEELQSTNEEMQSVNEELFLVNAEFQHTERERVELRSDERSIIGESNLGILFLDADLKIRKFSPMAGKLFSLVNSDFGRPFITAKGLLIQKIQGDVYEIFHGGELIEKKVEDENGLIYLVRINAYTSTDKSADDTINEGVVISFVNVTKLHATQKALEKSQICFDNTINAISDGYFEWILETDEVFFSPSFYQKLGYGDNRPNLERLLGKHAQEFKLKFAQTHLSGLKVEEIMSFISADGDVFWMICKGEFKLDEQRKQSKLIGIIIDFSTQKAVENTLQEQALELERSNNLLEKFAFIVSHDLKAPIRHIQNYLVFLKEAIESQDDQAVKQEMQSIQKSTDILTELVDDVITYARVTSEKKKVTDVNINNILDYVINIMTPIIVSKNIKVERDNIPSIKGDKSLLTHLMQNLISNACKYNDKESPLITISHSEDNKNHIITVTDNGIGFDQANTYKIFEPFTRLVTKDQFEGSGIGLSICKTVVEQHKGSIQVKSKVGEGASFTVKLPL